MNEFLSNEFKLKFICLLGLIKVNFINFTNILSIRLVVQLNKLYKHLIKTKKNYNYSIELDELMFFINKHIKKFKTG